MTLVDLCAAKPTSELFICVLYQMTFFQFIFIIIIILNNNSDPVKFVTDKVML